MSDANASTQWVSNTLINIADYHNGAAFKAKDWVEDGLPIIRIEQLNNSDAETDKYNGFLHPNNSIDDGDLIFSWSATLKVIIWDRGPGALNQHLYKVVPKQGIDRHLLLQILDFNMNRLSGQSQGSTMKHVTRKELSKFFVKYPSGEKEQKKIAHILQTIDQSIEKTEALIEKYQQIKAGLMHDLFTRGIGADGKLRPPRKQAPELYQETPIGWIPKEWSCVKACDICHPVTKGTTPSSFDTKNSKNAVPYIRVENLSFDGTLLFDEFSLFVDSNIHNSELSRSKIYSGDILINIVGPPLGKVSLVPGNFIEGNTNQAVAIYRTTKKANTEYVLYYLLSDFSQNWFYVRSKQTSGQVNITLEMCNGLEIPLPKREDELTEISQKLKEIFGVIRKEEECLNKLKKQKSGLMHDLLTGKVEVKVDKSNVTNG